MMAMLGGHLVANQASGLALDRGGDVVPVWWPWGWTARIDHNVAVLIDPSGKDFATVGDQISIGGGVGSDGWVHACAIGHSPADLIGSQSP